SPTTPSPDPPWPFSPARSPVFASRFSNRPIATTFTAPVTPARPARVTSPCGPSPLVFVLVIRRVRSGEKNEKPRRRIRPALRHPPPLIAVNRLKQKRPVASDQISEPTKCLHRGWHTASSRPLRS